MDKNSFVKSPDTIERNKERAWRNFMKTGRIEDCLEYFACKNSNQGGTSNAYPS